MAATTHFTLTANEAQAVQGYLKLVEAQGKVSDGFKKSVKAGNDLSSALSSIGSNIRSAVAGFISFQAVRGTLESVSQYMQRASDRTAELEGALTNLLAEGNNANNIGAVREQVLSLSAAFGQLPKDVAAAMADVQNGVEHMGGTIERDALQAALRLNKALGMELPQATATAIKSYQAWGDTLGDAAEAQGRIFTIAKGVSGIENVADFIAASGAEAKRAGISVDEFGGALQTLTLQGGRTRETVAVMRTLMKGIGDGVRQGVLPATGDLLQRFDQISKLDESMFSKLFGDDAQIARLVRSLDLVKSKIDEMRGSAGAMNLQLSKLLTDPSRRAVATAQAAKGAAEASISRRALDSSGRWSNYEMAKAGIEASKGPMGDALMPDWYRDYVAAGASIAPNSLGGPMIGAGYEKAIGEAYKARDMDMVNMLRLRGGKFTDTMVDVSPNDPGAQSAINDYKIVGYTHSSKYRVGRRSDGQMRVQRFTDDTDAQRLMELNARGYGNMGVPQYQEYVNAELQGKGNDYLALLASQQNSGGMQAGSMLTDAARMMLAAAAAQSKPRIQIGNPNNAE